MRTLLSLTLFSACALLLVSHSNGQTTVTSDPVGFTTTSCLSNSDTFVALPFTRAPEFVGAISSVSPNPTFNTINVSGTPWIANQFVYNNPNQRNHYYVLIGTGGSSNPKEGHIYNITGNSASSLTVDTTLENLSNITANTQILVIPHWTLATVFPPTDAGISFTPTTSVPNYKTQILPNFAFTGSNLPVSPTYYFDNAWRRVGDAATDYGDDVIPPNSYFVVRNANGAPTLPFTPVGSVLTKKFATPLVSTTGLQPKDNPAAMIRPVDVTLNASGLSPANGSFVASPPPKSIKDKGRLATKDQLLLFDNAQVAMSKTPSAVYYYSERGRQSRWLETFRRRPDRPRQRCDPGGNRNGDSKGQDCQQPDGILAQCSDLLRLEPNKSS